MKKRYNTTKILVLIVMISFVALVFPNVKSALSLDLTLPWLILERQVGPYLTYVKLPYLSSPVTTPFYSTYHATSIYLPVPFPERPLILRNFVLNIIGGGPAEIPERVFLTDSQFYNALTDGVNLDSGSKTVYLGGWCPPGEWVQEWMYGPWIWTGCHGVADVRQSSASFSGWDSVPAGNVLNISGNAGFVLYGTDNQVITGKSLGGSGSSQLYSLPLSLKSFLTWGGASTVTGYLRVSLEPAKLIKDLAVFIGDFKVFEKKGDILGIQSIDLTPQLAQISPYIKQIGDKVEIQSKTEMFDAQGNLITSPSISFTFNAIQPAELITLNTQKRLTIKTIDALTNQVLESRTIEPGLNPLLSTDKTSLEIFEENSKIKLNLKEINLPFYGAGVTTCDFDFNVSLEQDNRRKVISIDIPSGCQGTQNELEAPIDDLTGQIEKTKVVRCEAGICYPVDFTLNQAEKKVKITTPKFSKIIISDNLPELKNMCSKLGSTKAVLKIRSKGELVKILQAFLSADPKVYPEGLVTGYFGKSTQKAVKAFQAKYQNEILKPLGLKKPTGTFGPSTRNQLINLYCK